MSAAICVAARRSCCRWVDAIMDGWWQCVAGKKVGALVNLNCRLESHGQLHDNFDNYNVLGDRDDA